MSRVAERGAAARRDRALARRERRPEGATEFVIRASTAAGARRRGDHRRQRDVLGLPARAVRPRRPPVPVSVHELHELRTAVHDRRGRSLRPAAHDDGRLRDVRPLPGRVRGPRRSALPRSAERVPGVRAAGHARGPGRAARRRSDRAAAAPCAAARSSRSRGSGATTSPAAPTPSPSSPGSGAASTVRTSRSR